MTRAALTSLLALALLASGLAVALAAPGDPDASFGTGGKRVLDFGGEDGATDVVVQPDGKIVMASFGGDPASFQITRLNADGSPDGGFGAGGNATPDFGALGGEYATAVALGPEGKVVVVGFVDNGVEAGFDMAVLRLLANGQPDASFDGDGMLTVNLGEFETADAVAVKPDGGIVVGGTSTNGMLVTSLTATGAPDPGFNNGAPLVFNPVPQSLFVFGGGMVRLPDGSIVLATTIQTGEESADVALARLTPAGSLDSGFSDDGVALHDLGGNDFAGKLALQPDGKLVMAARTGPAVTGSAQPSASNSAPIRLPTSYSIPTSNASRAMPSTSRMGRFRTIRIRIAGCGAVSREVYAPLMPAVNLASLMGRPYRDCTEEPCDATSSGHVTHSPRSRSKPSVTS